jgi:autotransporter-associated beta strand protein
MKLYGWFGLFLFIGYFFVINVAQAQWIQKLDVGPYDYNDSHNWQGGFVNGIFTGETFPGLIVTFDRDLLLGSGTSITITNGSSSGDIIFRGEAGNRTLLLRGDIVATGKSGTKLYVFGSEYDGERLMVDLMGSDRVISCAQGQTVLFLNEIKSSVNASGIVKVGAGSLALAHDGNTFSGGVRVSGGNLIFSSIADMGVESSLGKGGVVELVAGGMGANKLQFGGDGVIVSANSKSNRAIVLTGSLSSFGIDNHSGHTLTLTADFINQATGDANKQLVISGNNSSVTEINGVIGNAGPNSITALAANGQDDAGVPFTLRLSGTANTFSGMVSTGYHTIIEVAKLANKGQASSIGTGSSDPSISIGGTSSTYGSMLSYIGIEDSSTDRPIILQFRANSINAISNDSPTNSNLAFTGTGNWTVSKAANTTNNNTLLLQGSSTGVSTISGRIVDETTDERNKTSLTVNGAGAWRLTNNNTFSGTTTVSGGTLIVDGELSKTAGVQVEQGTLSGHGSINQLAKVVVESSGIIAPGCDGEVGQLNMGALVFKPGAGYKIDFNSDLLLMDLINVSATLELGDGQAWLWAGIDLGTTLVEAGTAFAILQSNGLSGHFANDELWLGSNLFQIDYTANSVLLVAVPEPVTGSLLLICLLCQFLHAKANRHSKISAKCRR